MLEGKDYQSSDKSFLFIMALIDRGTEQERKAPMTAVHTCYSENVADVTRDMRQPA